MNHDNNEIDNTCTVLVQYKLYVEMADRISSRRLSANSFFLSINTALIAFTGYLSNIASNSYLPSSLATTSIAGIILCYMWYRLIRSYKDLNTAKFKVIHKIETMLPYNPYDAEWIEVGEGKDKTKYLPFTNIEMGVPRVFLVMHAIVLGSNIPWGAVFNCVKV